MDHDELESVATQSVRGPTVASTSGRLSRRDFVSGSVAVGAAIWISSGLPRPLAAEASRRSEARASLTRAEWAMLDAMTARLIPTDETPGAREANCVNFIDKALAHEDADALPLYRAALRELQRICRARFQRTYAELDESQQDALIRDLENDSIGGWKADGVSQNAFFETLRMHTILGFVLDPSYGGNRDYAGWKAMGFPGPVHHLGGSQPDQMRGEREFVPIWKRGEQKAVHDPPPPPAERASGR